MSDYPASAEKSGTLRRLQAHKDQALIGHLRSVGRRAETFARRFGGEEHGRLAGLLHDLGKAEDEFQKRIESGDKKGEKEPHAHHGAALVLTNDPRRGGPVWPVAFAINGHHAGLHDRSNVQKRAGFLQKALNAEQKLTEEENLQNGQDIEWSGPAWPVADFGQNLPPWLDNLSAATPFDRDTKVRAVDLYTRFLFSALIDADRLDTESHDPKTKDNYKKRHSWRFGDSGLTMKGAPEELLTMLRRSIKERREVAISQGASADVLEVRSRVLESCESAALRERGVFTLTVPTGGGKTLASLYFALRHIAAQNQQADENSKLRRIIVVIPYLSIIQQTVLELKDVFQHSQDDPVLLEHHSQAQDLPLPPGRQSGKGDMDDYSHTRTMRQLAAENWEAPIIVTTSVQFFDSLFSRRPADARKLHNIAQSVLIFDEVQTFPPLMMQPIVDALGELTSRERAYGCSLVLCTATQPALLKSDYLPCGFAEVKQIIERPEEFFRQLRRTSYPELETRGPVPVKPWPELKNEIFSGPYGQGLIIVNTRRQARELFAELQKSKEHEGSVFHLSTWMTPTHRDAVLEEVRRRLKAKEPCFLVSTQCVEAGVDVDFPAVWRAFGPYDAIAQAAGRCNRNGALRDENGLPALGQVRVFYPEDQALPGGIYKTAISQTELLRRMGAADPHNPASFETYFQLLYQLSVPDECEIQREREQLHFEKVSDLFRMIDTFTVPLIVPRWLDTGSRSEKDFFVQAGKEEEPVGSWLEKRLAKKFLLPDEWRLIQPHILNLDLRNEKQRAMLHQCASPAFGGEKPAEATLWILDTCSLYEGGLHGAGLDVTASSLNLLIGGL